jgi:hypothetical protein
MKKILIIIGALVFFSNFATANELYRAPSAGDKGAYYILEIEDLGNNIIRVLSSRIGKGNAYTDFTELKVNCKSKQYFELAGSSEDGAKEKPTQKLKDWSKNSKWTSLIQGSSKYDLVNYICKKN